MALFKKKKEDLKNEEQSQMLAQRIYKMYKMAYDSKHEYHDTWDDCYKAYTGELFEKNLPDYKSQEISNFIFSTIESIKPVMLADRPKILALPQKEELMQKSNMVQQVMDYEWSRTKMFSQLSKALTSGLIFGTVPIALIWDGEAQNGLGDVKPIIINPFNFFVDPMATSIEDAEYVIYATYKHIGELTKAYPDKKEELKLATSAPSDEYLSYGKDVSNVRPGDNVLYIECYMRDYTTVEEIVQEGEESYKVTKPKYPHGRYVAIAGLGSVVLDDKDNPYQDGKFPFVLWKCYDMPGKFWGMGEVEQVISPQQYISELTNNILDSAKLMSNPIWILDKNSGVERNSLTNRNGLVVRKNPGTEVKREAPPALPAYIQNVLEMLQKHMEIIPGVFDVTRGEKPSGITAGVAIQALTETAQGRIKLKVQALEQTLSELGGLWLSRIQQFWVTKRTVYTMGGDYKANYSQINKDDIDGDFDIIIASGSTMPVNKTARLQQLTQMAQTMAEDGLPMVDRKTILENADINNLDEVLQRFAQIAQSKQQAQQNLPSASISFKDLPPEGKVQLAQQAGIQISPEGLGQQDAQAIQQQQMQMQGQAQNQQQMAESQMQNQMQQQQMQHEMQMTQMAEKHKHELDKAELTHKQKLEQMKQQNSVKQENNSLQSNKSDIQLGQDNGNSVAQSPQQDTNNVQPIDQGEMQALVQVIQILSKMSPSQVQELASKNPQVAQAIQQMQQLPPEILQQVLAQAGVGQAPNNPQR